MSDNLDRIRRLVELNPSSIAEGIRQMRRDRSNSVTVTVLDDRGNPCRLTGLRMRWEFDRLVLTEVDSPAPDSE